MKVSLGIFIGGLLLAALGTGCAGERELPVETPPSGVTPIPSSPQAGPEIPTLTAEQLTKAEQIIAADPTLSGIVDRGGYTVTDIGPWTGGVDPQTGEYLLIGATARVILAEPVPRVETDWPYAVSRPHYYEWPAELRERFPVPYWEGTTPFTVENLTEMDAKVDLAREKLVQIVVLPLPGGQEVTYPLAPTPVPGDVELAQQIFEDDKQVQALLSGRDYEILGVSAIAFDDSRLGSVIVRWDDREDIERDWPLLIDSDEETGAYEIQTIPFTAETVGRLDVLIDLDKQRVIAIEPSVGD